MEYMEISGRTVEDAIQLALEQLNIGREEAEIIVIKEGKPGILGRGAEEAKIRVRPLVSISNKESNMAEVAKGVLEVLLNGMGISATVVHGASSFAEGEEGAEAPITLDIEGEDLGILIGTDYFPGIKGIGPKKALTLIRKYHTIEKIAFHEKDKYDFAQLSMELLHKIRRVFLFPDVNEHINELYWNMPNSSKVMTLLCKDHHLNEDRVHDNLGKLISNFNSCRAYFTHLEAKPRSIQITLDKLI